MKEQFEFVCFICIPSQNRGALLWKIPESIISSANFPEKKPEISKIRKGLGVSVKIGLEEAIRQSLRPGERP